MMDFRTIIFVEVNRKIFGRALLEGDGRVLSRYNQTIWNNPNESNDIRRLKIYI